MYRFDEPPYLDADGGELPPGGAPDFVLRKADSHGLGLSGRRRRRAAHTGTGYRYGDVGHQGQGSFGQAARPGAGGAVRGVAAS